MSKIFGVLGHPLGHSLSPAMFEAAFWQYSMEAEYLKFDLAAEELSSFLQKARTQPIEGFSVTVPYKEDILAFLDDIDGKATAIGAVNTVVNKKGKLKGYNTDWFGAMRALEEVTALEGKRVLILGAGGAAASIVYGCLIAGAKVTILNRSLGKAQELVERFKKLDLVNGLKAATINEILQYPADILIHTTSIGMAPNTDASLVPPEYFKRGMVVFDIVYNPLETRLVKQAKAAGCKVVSGYKMLLYQAEKQFELWFKKKPPMQKMEEALLQALQD